MELTKAAKLLAQFEKLQQVYDNRTIVPPWLEKVMEFLEYHRHDSVITMKQLATHWHRKHDSASEGNLADQMIRANQEFKSANMKTTIDA